MATKAAAKRKKTTKADEPNEETEGPVLPPITDSGLVNFTGSQRRKYQRVSGCSYSASIFMLESLEDEGASLAIKDVNGNVVDLADVVELLLGVYYEKKHPEITPEVLSEMGFMDMFTALNGGDVDPK